MVVSNTFFNVQLEGKRTLMKTLSTAKLIIYLKSEGNRGHHLMQTDQCSEAAPQTRQLNLLRIYHLDYSSILEHIIPLEFVLTDSKDKKWFKY